MPIAFRNHYPDGPTYHEVRQVNYQWRCTCLMFKWTKDCNHIQTVANQQMYIENEIIDCPDYEQTVQQSINHFHGKIVKLNKANSSPWR
jgi:hypothetical protein